MSTESPDTVNPEPRLVFEATDPSDDSDSPPGPAPEPKPDPSLPVHRTPHGQTDDAAGREPVAAEPAPPGKWAIRFRVVLFILCVILFVYIMIFGKSRGRRRRKRLGDDAGFGLNLFDWALHNGF
jgi:hypothetical protein